MLAAPETDIGELLQQADLMAAQLRGSERDIASLVKGSGQSLGAAVVESTPFSAASTAASRCSSSHARCRQRS